MSAPRTAATRAVLAAVMLSTWGLGAAAASAAPAPKPATYFVSPVGKNPRACKVNNAKTPFKTIAFALTCATRPIDTVQLSAGTYAESVTLAVGLTLTGPTTGGALIDATGLAHGLTITAGTQPTVSYLTVQSATDAGVLLNGGGTLVNVSSNGNQGAGFLIDTADPLALNGARAAGNLRGVDVVRAANVSTVLLNGGLVAGNGDFDIGTGVVPSDAPATTVSLEIAGVEATNAPAGVMVGPGGAGSSISVRVDGSALHGNQVGIQVASASADLHNNRLYGNNQGQFQVAGNGASLTMTGDDVSCYPAGQQFGSIVDTATLTANGVGWVYGGTVTTSPGPNPADVLNNNGTANLLNSRVTGFGCF